MTVGERIHYLRKQHGMTQEMLAEQIGVSRQALARWEADETLPDTANLIKLSDAFSVSTDWLLRGEKKSQPAAELPKPMRLSRRAVQLIDTHGYVGAYLLAAGNLVGALVCLAIAGAYLSVLLSLAPLRAWIKIPPALLLPGAGVFAALFCLVRAVIWFVLGRKMKQIH
ncbi:MAG: helix-turn-helix domain-containing protein [Clostridia bacterium]|nr:helix-turn-helix domain-containing protein [Clostridia bacterium]